MILLEWMINLRGSLKVEREIQKYFNFKCKQVRVIYLYEGHVGDLICTIRNEITIVKGHQRFNRQREC